MGSTPTVCFDYSYACPMRIITESDQVIFDSLNFRWWVRRCWHRLLLSVGIRKLSDLPQNGKSYLAANYVAELYKISPTDAFFPAEDTDDAGP